MYKLFLMVKVMICFRLSWTKLCHTYVTIKVYIFLPSEHVALPEKIVIPGMPEYRSQWKRKSQQYDCIAIFPIHVSQV